MLASYYGDLDSGLGDLKVRFMVDGWHCSRFYSEFFSFLPHVLVPPLLGTHLLPPQNVCISPDQAVILSYSQP